MNKAIIITGVSSGLGEALFDQLIEHKVRLCCISRQFLPKQIDYAKNNKHIVLLSCNLSALSEVEKTLPAAIEFISDSDEVIFINNAATIEPIGMIGALAQKSLVEAAHTNMVSPMLLANALCGVKQVCAFSVIDISSGAAHTPIAGWSTYCATKAAMQMFFEVLQLQPTKDKKITVHSFDPGVMDTNMQKEIRESDMASFPEVEEFREYKNNDELRDPKVVAAELIGKYIHV